MFATLQPVMLVVGWLIFFIDSWLKKYLLMYVFTTKNESGGAFWRMLFNRFLFAAGFSNAIIVLVVWVQYGGSWAWAWVCPLFAILIAFKIFCNRKFDGPMHFHTKGSDRESLVMTGGPGGPVPVAKLRRRRDKLSTRFGHPALYQQLIHPIVHANAQHVFKEIYKGRVHTHDEHSSMRPSMYGEISLDSMSHNQPGKRAGGGDTGPVQFVGEHDMDFSMWQHKPGFAEGASERGSFYGGGGGGGMDTPGANTPGWATPTGLRSQSPGPNSMQQQYHDKHPHHMPYNSRPSSPLAHSGPGLVLPLGPAPSRGGSPLPSPGLGPQHSPSLRPGYAPSSHSYADSMSENLLAGAVAPGQQPHTHYQQQQQQQGLQGYYGLAPMSSPSLGGGNRSPSPGYQDHQQMYDMPPPPSGHGQQQERWDYDRYRRGG